MGRKVEERPIGRIFRPFDARYVTTKASAQRREERRAAGPVDTDATVSLARVERILAHGDLTDARSWLAAASSRNALSRMVRDVLATDDGLEEVASRSYVHNNGFDKVVLADRVSWALRLHIWWPDQSPVDVEHVHDHAWDFISTIVTGSYHMDLYRDGDGDEWLEYRYEFPEGRPEMHGLRHVGRRRLIKVLSIHVPEGGSYAIHGGQLHRVATVPGALTSSLVLQGPVVGDGSTVLSESAIPAAANVPTEHFSVHDLQSRLMRYLGALESDR
jgi:hypothetical protein